MQIRKNTKTESKKNSSTLGVIGVVGGRGKGEGRGGEGKEGEEGVGRGGEGDGRLRVMDISPLSMRMDLEKKLKSVYVVSGPKIVDDKYVPIDWK